MTPDTSLLPDALDVLLVEDDPLEAELTLRPLRQLGPRWRIDVARDGDEALDYLFGRGAYRHRFGAPMPRLMLLDTKLPRADGLDVLRAIRGNPRTGAIPVVLLVAAADPRELAQAYQLGANSCIRKPVDFEEFRHTLRALAGYWLEVNEPPPTAARVT